jgi:energy-coupling factor transport system ATP-binding protein
VYKISPFKFTYKKFDDSNEVISSVYSEEEINISENGLYLISGNSGTGKSTFLNLLKGISPKFIPGKLEGNIYYNKKDINSSEHNEFDSEVVYLFQNPFAQIIHQDMELEFAFTQENLRIPEKEYIQNFKEMDKIFELENVWGTKTNLLSNGECQKLVLASLIAISPKVVLLDEPTAFLDPASRKNFYAILNKIKKNHIIIIVDHHVDEIASECDGFLQVSSNGKINFSKIFSSEKGLIKNYDDQFEENKEQIKIDIQDLTFFYKKEKKIIEKCNLTIKSGEVIVINGKNGAGKSTLFKLLAGIIKPKNGKVDYFLNEKLQSKQEISKIVGIVFQNPENNFFYDTLKEEVEKGSTEIISRFFSGKELSKSPYMFSEGQKRRISLLINLILKKKIIFYDEPTFGQDKQNINLISETILELKRKNHLQIIISHDDAFIDRVATKIFTLNEGELNEVKKL